MIPFPLYLKYTQRWMPSVVLPILSLAAFRAPFHIPYHCPSILILWDIYIRHSRSILHTAYTPGGSILVIIMRDSIIVWTTIIGIIIFRTIIVSLELQLSCELWWSLEPGFSWGLLLSFGLLSPSKMIHEKLSKLSFSIWNVNIHGALINLQIIIIPWTVLCKC